MRLLLVGETHDEYRLALIVQGRGYDVQLDRVDHWTWVEGEPIDVYDFREDYVTLRSTWLSGNYQIPTA